MRSGRKFSTNPINAMPGRLMSLTVISQRDASDSDNRSSWRSSRWSSYSRVMLSDFTRPSGFVVHRVVVRAHGLGRQRAVPAAGAARRAHALLLAAAHAVLEAVGRELDGGAGVGVRLGDDDVLVVRA